MRRFHRWIMTVFAVLVGYWVLSGLLLAIVDLTDSQRGWSNDGGGPGASTPKVVGGLVVATANAISATQVDEMTATTLQAARAADATDRIEALELSVPDGVPHGAVTFGDKARRRMVFNARTGQLIDGHAAPAPPGDDPENSRHSLVKNWHRGSVGAGDNASLTPGNLLALAAGAALCLLTLTGIVMYVDLWRARRRAGRGGVFWS